MVFMVPQRRLRRFTDKIWSWYIAHKRDLPWRDLWCEPEERRAYKVFVSEVMLQQTQVPRVTILFPEFLKKFPTLEVLGHASNREVILAWRGMGYNSRALRLRDAARAIGGVPLSLTLPRGGREFPHAMEELLSIPGIGPYTAAAIRNFAFNIPTPCLDTNIRRVLHREFFGPENPDGTWITTDRELLSLAGAILEIATNHYPPQTTNYPAADWHHALMDYGSIKEKAKKTSRNIHKEPGRLVGSRYIPNRIFRGKAVEVLRDQSGGLKLEEVGKCICSDWDADIHRTWLLNILEKLKKDAMVMERKGKYMLKE